MRPAPGSWTARCGRRGAARRSALSDVDPAAIAAVVEAMAARDPQADIVLSLVCPACEATTVVLLDVGVWSGNGSTRGPGASSPTSTSSPVPTGGRNEPFSP